MNNKKQMLILSIVIIFVFSLLILVYYSKDNNKTIIMNEKNTNNNKAISIMLETGLETGVYELSESTSFPSSGYILNTTRSGCENGSALSYDKVTKEVIIKGNISDKCYLYFDLLRQVELVLSNNTFSWDPVSEADSYNIYVDDTLVANVSNPQIELYKYLRSGGTYSVRVVAVNTQNNEISSGEYDNYTVSQASPTVRQGISDNPYYDMPPEYSEYVIPDFDYINVLNFNQITTDYLGKTDAICSNLEYCLSWSDWFNGSDDVNTYFHQYVFANYCALNPTHCDVYNSSQSLTFEAYIILPDYVIEPIDEVITNKLSYTINRLENKLYYNNLSSFSCSYAGSSLYIQFCKEGYVPSEWVELTPHWACFDENTIVYYYDEKKRKFKKKKAKNVKYKDKLLVWDFDNGCFAIASPIWIKQKEIIYQYNLLKFSDGSTLKTVGHHRIFNVEKGRFTYPLTNDTPIGTTTFNSRGEYVKLVSAEIIHKKINYTNIITNYHMNLFTNDILTSCRLNNIYEIKDMKFVKDNRKLKSFEEFKDIDEKWYNGLRLSEYNDSVNKDARHAKELKEYIKRLKNLAKKDN